MKIKNLKTQEIRKADKFNKGQIPAKQLKEIKGGFIVEEEPDGF